MVYSLNILTPQYNFFKFFLSDAINTQIHDTTGASPYELVLGQKPCSVVFPTTSLVDENIREKT